MPSGRFINLRTKPFKESDLIVDVLSKEGERLTFTAKNAAKSKRRFSGGVLEPLNFVEIQYTQAKSGFYYIQEAKLINSFPGLRTDYKKLESAFHFLKLISKVTHEGLKDGPQLFDLLGNTLKALENSEDPSLLRLQFELKFLYCLGFLALDEDTKEFIALPMSLNGQIHLTHEEAIYLNQFVRLQLKQIEVISESESL
jgi:DNA repair protein RecO (recombination protein O)